MILDRFLLRTEFTLDQPPEVHPNRWAGMLRWYLSRLEYNDKFDFNAEIREEVLEEIAMKRDLERENLRWWDDTDYAIS